MAVSDTLTMAWAEVQKANLPPELHPVAFQEAIRLLTREVVPNSGNERGGRKSGAGRSSGRATPTASSQPAIEVNEDEFFTKVSEETGVDRDLLEQVIHLDEGSPRLNLPGRRLGGSARARMVTVAQILAVARYCGLDEMETSTKIVREECRRLNCMDQNINSYLSALEGITYAGPRDQKVLKVRSAAIESFPTTISQVLGEPPVKS